MLDGARWNYLSISAIQALVRLILIEAVKMPLSPLAPLRSPGSPSNGIARPEWRRVGVFLQWRMIADAYRH